MKKITLIVALVCCSFFAFSQVLPSFQFGLKGGVNLAKFKTTNTFSGDNQAGYYAGAWFRIGAAGIHLQPEIYLSGKNASVLTSGPENNVKFTSIDVPVLIGTKIGAAGIGFRLNTGPVVSFILDDKQSFSQAVSSAGAGNVKDQNFAWQFGTGLDLGKLGFDLRYELGLTKVYTQSTASAKLNLFTFGIAYKLL